MRESDLAKPIANWLRSKGYVVYSEVPYWDRCVDMVGLNNQEICIVELKLRYSKKGVLQAMKTQSATSDVYLAVGKMPTQKSVGICDKYGIGLLVVSNNIITVVLSPRRVKDTWEVMSKHLIENCTEPSDDAGIACMSGCGPAQAVYQMVESYVKNHPKARWKEIYENIPNHYSNHKSLACAMSGYLKSPLYKIKEDLAQ